MAERNYSITIKYKAPSSESPIAGDNKESDTEKGKGLLSKQGAKTFATAMVAYGKVKSFATQIINHEVSMVELRTGSREMQDRANFTNEMIQKGVGILESVGTGALVGGLPGALVGLTLSAMHTAIAYQQKQETINLQRTIENVSLQQNFIRAGAKGSRSE